MTLDPKLLQVVREQIASDLRTGTCGLTEACWVGSTELTEEHELRLSEESQLEIIAICSIVNDLHDRVEELLDAMPELPELNSE